MTPIWTCSAEGRTSLLRRRRRIGLCVC